MKVLITGNSGYIGSHLTKILFRDSSIEMHGLDKRQIKFWVHNQFYQDISLADWDIDDEYDCVVHLAGQISVKESYIDPIKYYSSNVTGTINLLKGVKTKRFVIASTGAAESMSSPYAVSKRAAEQVVEQHCREKNIPYTIFRFYNVIGCDGAYPTNPDGLMYNLIQAKESKEFNLYGNDYNTRDGTCIRDYVHVNEVCQAIIKAMLESTNSIENLGHGIGHSVKEIIEIFKQVNNCDFTVNICERRDGDIEQSVLDNPSQFMQKLYSIEELLKV